MQRLIPVCLGHRNVILELAGRRLVHVMNNAQNPVTSIDAIDDDSKGVDVHDIAER